VNRGLGSIELMRLTLLTGRVAMRDDVIPLSTPYTDVDGTVHESLRCATLSAATPSIPILTRFLELKHPQRPGDLTPHPRVEPRPRDLGYRCIGVQVGLRTPVSSRCTRSQKIQTRTMGGFHAPHHLHPRRVGPHADFPGGSARLYRTSLLARRVSSFGCNLEWT
jgi:hypothetical protein